MNDLVDENRDEKKKKFLIKSLIVLIFGIFFIVCSFWLIESNSTEEVEISTSVTDVVSSVEDSCVAVTAGDTSGYSLGSGIIFKEDNNTYYVITNYHVIEDYVDNSAAYFRIYVDSDYTYYSATVTSYLSYQKDLAVLTFTSTLISYPIIELSTDYLPVVTQAETVIAIGCPLGLDYFNTVCTGVVSKEEYSVTNNGGSLNVIQNSCSINPGNSGGGLFNLAGELVGINFEKYTSIDEGDDTVVVEGVSFAIAIDEVIDFLSNNGVI